MNRVEKGRDHDGTVNRKAFFTNFSTYDAPFPTRARLALGEQLEEAPQPIRLLWELRSARLLTAGRGAP
jgi:hypothetical protein